MIANLDDRTPDFEGTFLSYLATIRPIEPRWQFWMEMMMIVEVATIEVLPLHNGCHLEPCRPSVYILSPATVVFSVFI